MHPLYLSYLTKFDKFRAIWNSIWITGFNKSWLWVRCTFVKTQCAFRGFIEPFPSWTFIWFLKVMNFINWLGKTNESYLQKSDNLFCLQKSYAQQHLAYMEKRFQIHFCCPRTTSEMGIHAPMQGLKSSHSMRSSLTSTWSPVEFQYHWFW